MRSHRPRCAIFSASLSTLLSLAAPSLAHAQLASAAPFNPADMPGLSMPTASPQGEAMPPATIGGLVAPAVANRGAGNSDRSNFDQANAGGMQGAVQPVAFNAFSSPGGPMAATQVQAPASELRDVPNGNPANAPNGYTNAYAQQAYAQQAYARQAYAQQGYAQPGYGQSVYRNTAMQQQAVFPPGGFQGNGYAGQQMNLPPSQMRNDPAANTMAGQPTGTNTLPVVSGDPRFVSPAPRMSNYATTPYRPFRTVAYQLPQQQPPVMPVQPPSALANQPQSVPLTSYQPQFQPTVGQLASYQVNQVGANCGPMIPANGVPSYVPGAVVPPTLTPNLTPQMYTPDNAGYRPLFSLGQENYNVQLGRGIIGQPTVYVTGQPIRNFLRYLSP